jgi:hypothetical protein
MSSYGYKQAPLIRAAIAPNESLEADLSHEVCPNAQAVFDPAWHARMYAHYGELYYDLYALGVQHELQSLRRKVR